MKIVFDLHTHTLACGHAYSTIYENIEFAKKKGLLAYGFSEHAKAMPGCKNDIFYSNQRLLPKEMDGMKIYCGAEANILDTKGTIDLTENTCAVVDYIIASLHTVCIEPGTVEENTAALVGAMQNPLIKIIGHPDDSRYPIDYDVVVREAVRTNTILELNNSSLNPLSMREGAEKNIVTLLEKCREYNAKVIANSDSHVCYDVGEVGRAMDIVERINFPRELIINTDIENMKYVLNKPMH